MNLKHVEMAAALLSERLGLDATVAYALAADIERLPRLHCWKFKWEGNERYGNRIDVLVQAYTEAEARKLVIASIRAERWNGPEKIFGEGNMFALTEDAPRELLADHYCGEPW